MNITIASIGRFGKKDVARSLYDEYAGRSRWTITLRELEVKKRLSGPALTEAEATLLEQACPQGAKRIVLDERGKSLPSPKFADQLGRWQDEGINQICLMIGGADGHAHSIRQSADLLLSLGSMTWPHLLVRGLVAEQVYRAQCILTGHPYHRV
ncbi:MAG: 23S rRNA (pseudouridine(1915)-N(3))-methyltransferase RlmH [Alphaproteobacteria bacterium]